jgi:hypothetical protein
VTDIKMCDRGITGSGAVGPPLDTLCDREDLRALARLA